MFSNISFEVGALLLLAAILMYGTVTGFVPRMFRRSTAAPMFVAVAVAGFVVYRFGPDISSYAGSLLPRPANAAAVVTLPAKEEAPRKVIKKPAVQNWRTTDVDAAVPVIVEPPPAVSDPAKGIEASSEDSPYDSGIKRAAKHLGRFLHIGRKKEP